MSAALVLHPLKHTNVTFLMSLAATFFSPAARDFLVAFRISLNQVSHRKEVGGAIRNSLMKET